MTWWHEHVFPHSCCRGSPPTTGGFHSQRGNRALPFLLLARLSFWALSRIVIDFKGHGTLITSHQRLGFKCFLWTVKMLYTEDNRIELNIGTTILDIFKNDDTYITFHIWFETEGCKNNHYQVEYITRAHPIISMYISTIYISSTYICVFCLSRGWYILPFGL